MADITKRFQNAWNAFLGRDPTKNRNPYLYGSGVRPDRPKFSIKNERSIVNSIYNRIALDCAAVNFEHVRVDENGRYVETIDDGLNECLRVDANMDQTGRAFIHDVVISMFDEGVVAIVPTDTSADPKITSSYEIYTLRTGKITEWFPYDVRVALYNERKGRREQVIVPKSSIAIVENPFYTVMNEPNSTLQRLIRTLNRIDRLNEQNSSGKMDLIVQLPYNLRTELRRQQAEERRAAITNQLMDSKYGIAYIDQAEKIVQLNRPIENQMWSQATDLTAMLYQQLGISDTILNGTADEQTMKNYYNNTIDPVVTAIAEEMIRKFLTPTARTQGQSIKFFRDPFKLVPVSQLADIADKFTRNEIATSNELRAEIGWKPAADPRADELRNKNLNESAQVSDQVDVYGNPINDDYDEEQNL
ncbi:MAG: phage portal protein [Clostridiales bacterium]|nr:phage portal protein [Clostridiales bacterium]